MSVVLNVPGTSTGAPGPTCFYGIFPTSDISQAQGGNNLYKLTIGGMVALLIDGTSNEADLLLQFFLQDSPVGQPFIRILRAGEKEMYRFAGSAIDFVVISNMTSGFPLPLGFGAFITNRQPANTAGYVLVSGSDTDFSIDTLPLSTQQIPVAKGLAAAGTNSYVLTIPPDTNGLLLLLENSAQVTALSVTGTQTGTPYFNQPAPFAAMVAIPVDAAHDSQVTLSITVAGGQTCQWYLTARRDSFLSAVVSLDLPAISATIAGTVNVARPTKNLTTTTYTAPTTPLQLVDVRNLDSGYNGFVFSCGSATLREYKVVGGTGTVYFDGPLPANTPLTVPVGLGESGINIYATDTGSGNQTIHCSEYADPAPPSAGTPVVSPSLAPGPITYVGPLTNALVDTRALGPSITGISYNSDSPGTPHLHVVGTLTGSIYYDGLIPGPGVTIMLPQAEGIQTFITDPNTGTFHLYPLLLQQPAIHTPGTPIVNPIGGNLGTGLNQTGLGNGTFNAGVNALNVATSPDLAALLVMLGSPANVTAMTVAGHQTGIQYYSAAGVPYGPIVPIPIAPVYDTSVDISITVAATKTTTYYVVGERSIVSDDLEFYGPLPTKSYATTVSGTVSGTQTLWSSNANPRPPNRFKRVLVITSMSGVQTTAGGAVTNTMSVTVQLISPTGTFTLPTSVYTSSSNNPATLGEFAGSTQSQIIPVDDIPTGWMGADTTWGANATLAVPAGSYAGEISVSLFVLTE